MSDSETYLATQVSTGKFQEIWLKAQQYNSKKLWHQLTLIIEEALVDEEFRKSIDIFELYESVIVPIETKIKKLSLARIFIRAANQKCSVSQLDSSSSSNDDATITTANHVIEQANALLKKVNSPHECAESSVFLLSKIGEIQLKQLRDLPACRASVERAETLLDAVDQIGEAHALFYKLSAAYHTLIGSHSKFYLDALRFLGCQQETQQQLSKEERSEWALKLCVSALLGDQVYNFGELVKHPILQEIPSQFAYLVQLVEAFNRGNLSAIVQLQPQWETQPDLRAALRFLYVKATMMCLMEMVFQRPADARLISFTDIAAATQQPLDQVELLVMKALSKGLVRGRIDQVNQLVSFTWVQPRILEIDQIDSLKQRVSAWLSTVSNISKTVKTTALEMQHV